MTPSGRSLSNSSVSDAYSGTPNVSATSGAAGPGSTIPESCAAWLASTSSMCRRPMSPAPATAMRTATSGLALGQLVQPVDGEWIAEHAEADDDPAGDRRDERVVPELLARVHVRDVQLDDGQLGALDGVVQRDGRVRMRPRVVDGADRVARRHLAAELLDPVDELALVVRLA